MSNDEALSLPSDSSVRKATPITTGVIDYFPAALAAVARVSKHGNDKHNPGEPLHWSRGKSNDHADAIARHLIDRGHIDPETGVRHSAELAWRALALLQVELEEAGEAPLARGARAAEDELEQFESDRKNPCNDRGPDGWHCERTKGHRGLHWFPRDEYNTASRSQETWE